MKYELSDTMTMLLAIACILIAVVISTSGCALTTPDGYHIEVDAEQLDSVLQRLEAYQAARDAAQAREDAEAAARWQMQVDRALELLRDLQNDRVR